MAAQSVVRTSVMFRCVVPEVFLPGVVTNFEHFLCLMAQQSEIPHVHCPQSLTLDSVGGDAHRRAVIAMDGGGWLGMPLSSRVSHIIFASNALRNRVPSSALAADAATHFRIVQSVRMVPLRWIGQPSLGTEPRKKCPDTRLQARGTGK